MKKALIIFSVIVMFSALTLAAPVEDLEFQPEDGFEKQLVGGEGFEQQINFTSDSEGKIPVEFRVAVEADSTLFEEGDLLGEEFQVTGVLKREGGLTDNYNLDFEPDIEDGGSKLVYTGHPESASSGESVGRPLRVPAEEDEYVTDLSIDSNKAIRPDSFEFEFGVRSVPGRASAEVSEVVFEDGSASAEIGDGSLEATSEEGAYLNMIFYDDLYLPGPELKDAFVKGVGIEVVGEGGDEVDGSGTGTLSYSEDLIDENDLEEGEIEVYWYKDSTQEWKTDPVEDLSVDTGQNQITFEAEHFSLYAAFTDTETTEEGGGDGSDGSTSGGGAEVYFDYQKQGLDVSFEDQSDFPGSEIVSYSWEFGDGGNAVGESVDHTYSEAGEYEVTLTLEDDEGDSFGRTRIIDVEDPQEDTGTEEGDEGDQDQQQQDENTEDQETEQTQPPENEEDESPQNEQAQGGVIAGQFFSNPSNMFIGFALLIAVAGLIYYYSGRLNGSGLRDFLKSLSS